MKSDQPTGENRRVISHLSERARSTSSREPGLTAAEVIREAISGTMDGRRQWRMIRDFTEEEVKVAVREMEGAGPYFTRSSAVPAMLFHRWGELDPVAANEAAKAMFPKGFSGSRQAVIAAWIKQGGGAAAWDAVREEGEIWDCTQSVPGEVADMLVASLSDLDDAAAFRVVRGLDDESSLVADTLCRARARKAFATAESRTAFLAAAAEHPDPYVLNCAREWLFREWAAKNVEAARAGAMAMTMSEDARRSVLYWVDSADRDKEQDAKEAAAREQ